VLPKISVTARFAKKARTRVIQQSPRRTPRGGDEKRARARQDRETRQRKKSGQRRRQDRRGARVREGQRVGMGGEERRGREGEKMASDE